MAHNPLAQFRGKDVPQPGMAQPKPAVAAPEPDGDEQPNEGVKIHVTKKPDGGYHSSVDSGDELGPDEQDHATIDEAVAAHAKALEAKFGEGELETAEEKISPGIHDKAGDYLSKIE